MDWGGKLPKLSDFGASDSTAEVVLQGSELWVEGPEGQDGGEESGLEQVFRVYAQALRSTAESSGLCCR